mgnify:CR=1 FL=1
MPKWVRKIDSHGRVTIPAELRRALRLKQGSRLVLVAEVDRIIIYPLSVWKRLQRTQP